MQSYDLKVRLPSDLPHWIAEKALRGRRSMNAVVIEAVELMKATWTDQMADDKHAAAIELAISLARLPKGTAVLLQTDYPNLRTNILIKASADPDYSVVARVSGEEVVFAEDPATTISETGV